MRHPQVGDEFKFTTGSGEERLYTLARIVPQGDNFADILELDRIHGGTACLWGTRWLREPLGSGHWEAA